ncbi:hypothetical protein [Priestia megaterium]|uniref:hypothetical protein n=1 Tax=Priestia megaterium TaxID=1404 RepID=UPI001FB47BF1|nr:hypothetical protein [Priestia megaterium]
MKIQDAISSDMLRTTQFILFNTETNWHVIYKQKVYKINRNLDDLFFSYEKGNYKWESLTRRLRFFINDIKTEPICLFNDFKLDEDIDCLYADDEKVSLQKEL